MNSIRRFSKLAMCFALAMVLTVLAPVSALASYSAIVTRSSRVYSQASTKSDSYKLSKGTLVTVKSTNKGVAKITYQGKTGYMKASDIKSVSDAAKQTKVCVSGAKAYNSKSTSARHVSVPQGTKVNVLSASGSWAKVERGGKIAYMPKNTLALYNKADSGEPKEDSASTPLKKVLKRAKSKLGTPYVFGAKGPNAFDCAGFVMYSYKAAGINLSRSAKGQGYGKGTKVSYKELKVGDIVFFNTVSDDDDLCDHSGIYLGGGKFIHASSGGGKVMISSLSGGYYKRVFSWGRRVL